MYDDLGFDLGSVAPPRRVVSLVPSLTEALALTVPGILIGATDWCTHPAGMTVKRLRGTKNPDLDGIRELRPDLVVANQEENRRADVDRLRAAGIPVWVTRIDSVPGALDSMGRLFSEVCLAGVPWWLDRARAVWNAPAQFPPLRVAVPVWKDPWIWVGAHTYPDDVLRRSGAHNVVTASRYPHLDPGEVLRRHPDLVLLPDEPYPFTRDDCPELSSATRTVCLPGRALFWYGPAMVDARKVLTDCFHAT